MPSKHVFKIKIILVGDCNTGKSTFIKKLNDCQGVYTYQPTMGVDFHIHKIIDKEDPNTEYYLYFYDTSGNSKFNSIISSYYSYCPLAIFFTRPKTYIDEQSMYTNLKKKVLDYKYFRTSGEVVILNNIDKSYNHSKYSDKTVKMFDKNELSLYDVPYKSFIQVDLSDGYKTRNVTDVLLSIIKEKLLLEEWIINITDGVNRIDEIIKYKDNNDKDNIVKTEKSKSNVCSIM